MSRRDVFQKKKCWSLLKNSCNFSVNLFFYWFVVHFCSMVFVIFRFIDVVFGWVFLQSVLNILYVCVSRFYKRNFCCSNFYRNLVTFVSYIFFLSFSWKLLFSNCFWFIFYFLITHSIHRLLVISVDVPLKILVFIKSFFNEFHVVSFYFTNSIFILILFNFLYYYRQYVNFTINPIWPKVFYIIILIKMSKEKWKQITMSICTL